MQPTTFLGLAPWICSSHKIGRGCLHVYDAQVVGGSADHSGGPRPSKRGASTQILAVQSLNSDVMPQSFTLGSNKSDKMYIGMRCMKRLPPIFFRGARESIQV